MNKTMVARLTALECERAGVAPICVVRQIIEADGTENEPEAYRDGRGNVWAREPGEDLEAFRERAAAGALAASPFGYGTAVIPYEEA